MNAELTEQAEAAREAGAAAGFTGAQCANETADCTHAAPAAAAVRTPGLYRSSYEHDACGIGALAHLKGQRSHAMLDDALSALVNLEHRGGTGLGAQHRRRRRRAVPDPAPLLPQGSPEVRASFLARRGRLRRGHALLPARRRPRASRDGEARRSRRAARSCGHPADVLARGACRPAATSVRPRRRACPPSCRRSCAAPPTSTLVGDFERKLYVCRRTIEQRRRRQRRRLRARSSTCCSMSCAHDRVQGHAWWPRRCAASSRDLNDAAVETSHGACALALLHEHHAVSWERAHPEPLHRPQRRDQHAARQHQLDTRSRAETVQRRSLGADLRAGAAHHQSARARTRRSSTTCWSSSDHERPSARHAPSPMMIPEPWDHNEPHLRQAPRLRRVPVHAHGAVGRPGGHRVHRRTACSAPCSIATACVRRATTSPRDDSAHPVVARSGALDVDPANDAAVPGCLGPRTRCSMVDPGQGRVHLRTMRFKRPVTPTRSRTAIGWIEAETLAVDDRWRPRCPAEAARRCRRRGRGPFGRAVWRYAGLPLTTTCEEAGASPWPMPGQGARWHPWATDTPLACLSKRPATASSITSTSCSPQVTNPPIDALRESLTSPASAAVSWVTTATCSRTARAIRAAWCSLDTPPCCTHGRVRCACAAIGRVGFKAAALRVPPMRRDAAEGAPEARALEELVQASVERARARRREHPGRC